MKKVLVLAMLLVTTINFAECRSLNLGFVTIISGTYLENVLVGYDDNLNGIYETVEVKCSDGDRWQWFWE